jgi:hypothetical protein
LADCLSSLGCADEAATTLGALLQRSPSPTSR